MLGDALSVQEFVRGNRTLHGIDVKVAIQVALPVNGIPARKCLFNGPHFLTQTRELNHSDFSHWTHVYELGVI